MIPTLAPHPLQLALPSGATEGFLGSERVDLEESWHTALLGFLQPLLTERLYYLCASSRTGSIRKRWIVRHSLPLVDSNT